MNYYKNEVKTRKTLHYDLDRSVKKNKHSYQLSSVPRTSRRFQYYWFFQSNQFLPYWRQTSNMVNVTSIQPSTVFAWFMFLMVLRRVVLLIVAMILGYRKPLIAGSHPPEDRLFKRGQVEPSSSSIATPLEFSKDVRINKIIHNDAENDIYFLILYLATAVYSDAALSRDCTRTVIYGTIYLFFRLCYTVAYIFALQPWRTLCFYCGLACTFAISLDLLITMSRQPN